MSARSPIAPGEALIVVLSRDLMITSRLTSEAQSAGIELRRIDSPELLEAVAKDRRGLLLLDLDMGLPTIEQVVRRARAIDAGAWHVCGFGSHVDGAGLRGMREAGADQVLSRSRLIQQMRALIAEYRSRVG